MFTSLKYSLRTIGLLALFPALTASAQVFVGSEDFNNGGTASNWDSVYRLNSATQGDLTFANNRLDFTKAAGTGNQSRLWNSDGTANPSVSTSTFTTSWVMTLLATNTQTVGGLPSQVQRWLGYGLMDWKRI